MNEHKSNFNSWFKEIVANLYSHREAGFIILMVAFPLLERYLREKSGVHEGNLNDGFYQELLSLYPELSSTEKAYQFWQVYRNGLLHQVTFSKQKKKGINMPEGWVSHDVDIISIDNDNFWVHPAKFAQRVIHTIENDFTTFEGSHSANHHLSKVHHSVSSAGTSAGDIYRFPKESED